MNNLEQTIQDITAEVKVDVEGKATISKYGLARLLDVSHSVLNRDRMAKKLAQTLTEYGFKSVTEDDRVPDVAMTLIAEYYAYEAQKTSPQAKQVHRALSAIGARTWCQQVTGYQPTQVKTQPKLSEIEQMRLASKALSQMVAVYDYANNKPGLTNMLSYATETDSKALSGLVTLDEILERRGLDLDRSDKSAIGMYAATAYRNLTGKPPERILKVYKYGNVNQRTKVAAYPLDFVPIIENAIDLGWESA